MNSPSNDNTNVQYFMPPKLETYNLQNNTSPNIDNNSNLGVHKIDSSSNQRLSNHIINPAPEANNVNVNTFNTVYKPGSWYK